VKGGKNQKRKKDQVKKQIEAKEASDERRTNGATTNTRVGSGPVAWNGSAGMWDGCTGKGDRHDPLFGEVCPAKSYLFTTSHGIKPVLQFSFECLAAGQRSCFSRLDLEPTNAPQAQVPERADA